jgi:hypothetical protein
MALPSVRGEALRACLSSSAWEEFPRVCSMHMASTHTQQGACLPAPSQLRSKVKGSTHEWLHGKGMKLGEAWIACRDLPRREGGRHHICDLSAPTLPMFWGGVPFTNGLRAFGTTGQLTGWRLWLASASSEGREEAILTSFVDKEWES